MPIKVCILARWKARNVIKKSCESEFRFCNRHPLVSPAYCRYPRFFGPPVPAAPSGASKCPLRSAFSLDPSSTCLPRVRKGDLCCGAGVRGGARGCAGVLGAGNGLILLDFGCFRQRRRFSKNLAKKIEKVGKCPHVLFGNSPPISAKDTSGSCLWDLTRRLQNRHSGHVVLYSFMLGPHSQKIGPIAHLYEVEKNKQHHDILVDGRGGISAAVDFEIKIDTDTI